MCIYSTSTGKGGVLPRRKWLHRNRTSHGTYNTSTGIKFNMTQVPRYSQATTNDIDFWDLSTLIVAASIIFTFTILAIVLVVFLDRKRKFRRKSIPIPKQRFGKCRCQESVYHEIKKPGKEKRHKTQGCLPSRITKSTNCNQSAKSEFARTRRPVIQPAEIADVIYETLDGKDWKRKKYQKSIKDSPLPKIESAYSNPLDAILPSSHPPERRPSSQVNSENSRGSQYDNPPCAHACQFCRSHSAPANNSSPYFELESQTRKTETVDLNFRGPKYQETVPEAMALEKNYGRRLIHSQSVILHDRLPPQPPIRTLPPPRNFNIYEPNHYPKFPRRFSCDNCAQSANLSNEYFSLEQQNQSRDVDYSEVRRTHKSHIPICEEASFKELGSSNYFVLERDYIPNQLQPMESKDSEYDFLSRGNYSRLSNRQSNIPIHQDCVRRMLSFDQEYLDRLRDNGGVRIVFLNQQSEGLANNDTDDNQKVKSDSVYDRLYFDSRRESLFDDNDTRERIHSSPA
ncbi:uncharacterized protein LOC126828221 [Patella vulgata]|uniref:uncharacterized protein LOC126828221 n=1 Tax=Patella vulgata TaxID=6465 RepID=UPI00217FEB1B|nr:uncharacterized protein LOC126828221 [Patella vulgata]